MKQVLVVLAVFLTPGLLQAHDPDRGHAEVTLGGKKVSIEYGRPELRGRDMLSQIRPGQEWRTGMDAETTLTSEVNLTVGQTTLPEGRYVVRTRLDEPGRWSLLLKEGDQIQVEIPMAVQQSPESVEKFTITLQPTGSDSASLRMAWGTLELTTDLKAH